MATKHVSKTTHDVSLVSYILGFTWSLILTIAAYLFTTLHLNTNHRQPSDGVLLLILGGLASIQLIVQLVYFLHVGRESRPRWYLISLLFAGLVVFIVLVGSIWIMNHLNYHMQTTDHSDAHILKDEGFDNRIH